MWNGSISSFWFCLSHVGYLLLFLPTECQKFFSDTLKVRLFSLMEGKRTCETPGLEREQNRREGRRKWKMDDDKQRKASARDQKKDIFELL